RWWRSRRGRGFPRRARCSFRGTTKFAACCRGRSELRRHALAGESATGRARPRGMARRRPVVDGGAGQPALLRCRVAVRGERRCLSRPRTRLLVHTARRVIKGQTKGQTFRSDPLLGVVLANPPQEVVEAATRRVDVQQARSLRPGIRERVRETKWRSDERAGAEVNGLVPEQELRLALEDVE